MTEALKRALKILLTSRNACIRSDTNVLTPVQQPRASYSTGNGPCLYRLRLNTGKQAHARAQSWEKSSRVF